MFNNISLVNSSPIVIMNKIKREISLLFNGKLDTEIGLKEYLTEKFVGRIFLSKADKRFLSTYCKIIFMYCRFHDFYWCIHAEKYQKVLLTQNFVDLKNEFKF